MTTPPAVRPATPADAPAMARVHVQSWRETYRDLMRSEVLDDPDLPASRERFWTAALTDPRWAANRVAVAEDADGEIVGIAMSGPPLDADASWDQYLYVLYLLAGEHGSGAGEALLNAVIDRDRVASLWVGDPVPRAQAFYRKQGFAPDGTVKIDGGVRELRFVRAAG